MAKINVTIVDEKKDTTPQIEVYLTRVSDGVILKARKVNQPLSLKSILKLGDDGEILLFKYADGLGLTTEGAAAHVKTTKEY